VSLISAAPALTLRQAALRVLDEAMADGTWQTTPLGREVQRYLRHRAAEFAESSIVDYRATLARLAVDHAHLELRDFEGGRGAELLEDFLHRRYRERAPSTRKKIRAQLRSFFGWATALDKLERNPAVRLTRPRRAQPNRRRAHSIERITAIIEAQPELRDHVAIALMARHGLRKNELRLLRWRDVDLQAGLMRLHAKGGKRPEVLIVFPDLLADLARLYLETGAKPAHYLLFPRRIGNLPTRGGRGVVAEFPEQPMQPSTASPLVEVLPRAGRSRRLSDARVAALGRHRVPAREPRFEADAGVHAARVDPHDGRLLPAPGRGRARRRAGGGRRALGVVKRVTSEFLAICGVNRRRAESNRCTGLCRPLPNLSATAPR
jgi:integrase